MENEDKNNFSPQISALFEIINIILEIESKLKEYLVENSVFNLFNYYYQSDIHIEQIRLSILNFAQKYVQSGNCCIPSLDMIRILLEKKMLIRKSNDVFEDSSVEDGSICLKGLEHSLKMILKNNNPDPIIVRNNCV